MKNSVLAIFLGLAVSCAQAEQASTNMNASASINNTCSFSVTSVAFNNYDPSLSQDLTANQTVEILCTRGTNWKFYTGASDLNNNNQFSYMSFNANKLVYQVQLVNGNWENDTYNNAALNASYTYSGTGTGLKQNLSLNYRVLKNQYVPAGNYRSDAIAYVQF